MYGNKSIPFCAVRFGGNAWNNVFFFKFFKKFQIAVEPRFKLYFFFSIFPFRVFFFFFQKRDRSRRAQSAGTSTVVGDEATAAAAAASSTGDRATSRASSPAVESIQRKRIFPEKLRRLLYAVAAAAPVAHAAAAASSPNRFDRPKVGRLTLLSERRRVYVRISIRLSGFVYLSAGSEDKRVRRLRGNGKIFVFFTCSARV